MTSDSTTMKLLDLSAPGGFSDVAETITRANMVARVEAVKARLVVEGLTRARLCLPVDAGLGTVAVLLALMEIGGRFALIARPGAGDVPVWPAFCDAVIMPPVPGAALDDLQIQRLSTPAEAETGPSGQIWVRSSGTTGTPKWMLLHRDDIFSNCRAVVDRLQLSSSDRVMVPVPIHHTFGLGAGFLSAVLAGAHVHLVARGNPLVIFQAQRSFAPTVMYLVPSQCRSMMALGRKAGKMRVVIVAGDRLSPSEAAVFEADHGMVINLYGSTEMSAISCGMLSDPPEVRHLVTGPPLDGVTLAMKAVPDDAAVVPLQITSKSAFRGYSDPETGALIAPAPNVWPTGDLVRLHDSPPGAANTDPRIEVMGRSDHAVNRDGLLVHLGQIEGCMAGVAGVALSAVIAAGQSRRGVGLVAFCTLARPGAATCEEILAHCRANLPPRAVPDVLHLIPEMPLLQSGKVDRRRLGEMAATSTSDASPPFG